MNTPTRKFTFPEPMWAGTEHSLSIAAELHEAMMAGIFDNQTKPEEAQVPDNFSIQGNVGIVTIRGPLVNNDSPYNKYRGVTSYADIRRTMIYAANQDAVKAIILDIDSGGGSVSGVADAGNLIATIDKQVKPVYAYTDGTMASAAYWLGSSTRGVYVSQTAMTGSIGVIATHQEYSKAFKEMGVGVTVMRAGEFKALANSMEPLTDVAKAKLQEQLNAAYEVFATHVSSQLGVSMPVFEKTMGQGREFFGAAAVDVGLAKGVKTFDSMVSMVQQKTIDSSAKQEHSAINNQRGFQMPRQALTEQEIAAMAAGVDIAAHAETAAEQAAAETAADAANAEAETTTTTASTETVADASAVLVTYLQGQVKEKDALLLTQTVELNGLKAKLATIESSHAGLVKIAANSLSTMKVGLGMTKTDYSAMSPETLLAEHEATSKAFCDAFKTGGVSAVSTEEQNKTTEATVVTDSVRAARLAATRFPTQTK